MATEVGSLYYDLTIDDKKLHAGLDAADSKVSKFGHTVAGVGKALVAGFAVAGAATTAFGVAAVKAFSESQNVIAQTNAVLKSTGNVAGVTADSATKLAQSLQKVTKFSDETIQGGENLLLTFTAIGKDIFPQATETMLNMSQALGQDVKNSAIQLGKALQDPILGVTALRRVGVNFSEKQQDVIKKLVETGKAGEAQALILKELQVEFGGSARAAGETFAGKLTILKNRLNDIQETIGQVIVKGLEPFVGKLADVVANIDWEAVIQKTIAAISNLWQNYLVPFGRAVFDVAEQVGAYLGPKLEALWNTVNEKLIPVLSRLWHEIIEPLAPVIGTVLVAAIGGAIDIVNGLLTVLAPLAQWMLDHKGTVIGLATAFGVLALAMNFNSIVAAFNGAINSAILMINTMRLVTIPSALTSMAQFAAGFGPIGIAAVVAAGMIIDAGNRAKAAWDRTTDAIKKASDSNDAVIRQLSSLKKTGTPEQQARATKALAGLMAGGSFASGVTNFSGGLAYVHQGELLVNLPKGTDVVPRNKTGEMMRSGDTVVNIGTIEDRQDADYILRYLDRKQQLTSMGLSS